MGHAGTVVSSMPHDFNQQNQKGTRKSGRKSLKQTEKFAKLKIMRTFVPAITMVPCPSG